MESSTDSFTKTDPDVTLSTSTFSSADYEEGKYDVWVIKIINII